VHGDRRFCRCAATGNEFTVVAIAVCRDNEAVRVKLACRNPSLDVPGL
jgi:hypothetical protein